MSHIEYRQVNDNELKIELTSQRVKITDMSNNPLNNRSIGNVARAIDSMGLEIESRNTYHYGRVHCYYRAGKVKDERKIPYPDWST